MSEKPDSIRELLEAAGAVPSNVDDSATVRGLAALVREYLEWRPIETAPKDGMRVLIWDEQDSSAKVAWFRDNGAWASLGEFSVTPTHWRPLGPGPEVPE